MATLIFQNLQLHGARSEKPRIFMKWRVHLEFLRVLYQEQFCPKSVAPIKGYTKYTSHCIKYICVYCVHVPFGILGFSGCSNNGLGN